MGVAGVTMPVMAVSLLRMLVLGSWLLLLIGLPSLQAHGGSVQDPEVEHRKCRYCDTTGMVLCEDKVHGRVDLSLEGNMVFCTHVGECPTCDGLGRIACGECERSDAAKLLKKMRERRKAAMVRHHELETEMKRKLSGGESDHFRLLWDIESLKIGRKRFDQHELLHLFAERMEAVHARYLEVLHVKEREIPDRSGIAVWWLPNDHSEAARRFCGGNASMGVKRMGPNPFFSTCGSRSHFPTDDDLHRYLVHNAAHLLLSNNLPSLWMGQYKGGGWFDEGLASWFEIDLVERAQTWCFQEQGVGGPWGKGNWRVAVRKLVQQDRQASVATVLSRDVNTLEQAEQAIAFSLIDYLIHLDGSKLPAVAERLKNKKPAREALIEHYGLSPLALETAWKAWVLETYPKR